jgi:diguanylate cyclase (GGDEF)-like protein/PAS domain S-box-containing protein
VEKMLSVLNHLSVRNRIRMMVLILIGSIVAVSVIDVLLLRGALWREKENSTRQLVESSFSVLVHFHELQKKGELTQAAAQAAAIGTIKAMRYANHEYFWLNDLGTPFPRMIMHPTMPLLDGQVLDAEQFNRATRQQVGAEGNFVDTDGQKNLFVAFVDVVKQGGEGYVTYGWPKPKAGNGVTEQIFSKLSFVKKFEPWGWVIGSGNYIDDVDAAVQKQIKRNLLLLAGAGIVLLTFASLIARSITQPLRRTVVTMRAIGLGSGGLTQRLPVDGRSEIAELAGGFNDMLDHLAVRDAELARHRESLEEEVAHRTVELRDTNRQLGKELLERQQTEQALHESRARIRALLDASDESVLLLDLEGKILAINACAAQRFGQTPEPMTGKNFFDLLSPDLAEIRRAAIQRVAITGDPMHLQDRRGSTFFDNSIYPVKDESGGVTSIAVYAKDVSEQHRATALEDLFRHLDTVLLKWQMNLESISQIFCDGILPVFDLAAAWIGRAEKDGRLTLLASAEQLDKGLLGPLQQRSLRWDGEPGCCLPAGDVIRSGHWQIVAAAERECQSCNAVADAKAHGALPVLLLPLILRGETWGVLTLYGRDARQFDGAQLPLHLAAIAGRLGTALESALQQEWLTLLDTALAGVDNAVFITDANAAILWANRAFTQLSGYAPEEILGKTPKLFSSGEQAADFYQRFWQTISSGRTWHGDIVNARRNGSRYTVNQTVTPLLNTNGQVSHYVAILEDISARKVEDERVRHIANFDLLTDLPNRGLFFDRLGQALALARRDKLSGALLFLDLDRFKEVNDQLGHAAGDRLLIAVAKRLREQVRESDTVARLGGDEFTVILPNLHDGNDAIRVADNILAAIARPFHIDGNEASVGVSIGIALFPAQGNTAEHILNAADNAMYLAKKAGRNCYVFAPTEAAGNVEPAQLDS